MSVEHHAMQCYLFTSTWSTCFHWMLMMIYGKILGSQRQIIQGIHHYGCVMRMFGMGSGQCWNRIAVWKRKHDWRWSKPHCKNGLLKSGPLLSGQSRQLQVSILSGAHNALKVMLMDCYINWSNTSNVYFSCVLGGRDHLSLFPLSLISTPGALLQRSY